MTDPAHMSFEQRHALADRIESEFVATRWELQPAARRHLIVSIASAGSDPS
jgi:hypothetical protein